jgi:hypothetical protein
MQNHYRRHSPNMPVKFFEHSEVNQESGDWQEKPQF